MSIHEGRRFDTCTPCGMGESIYIGITGLFNDPSLNFCNLLSQKKWEEAEKILAENPSLQSDPEESQKIVKKIIDHDAIDEIQKLLNFGFTINLSNLHYSLRENSLLSRSRDMAFKAILTYRKLDLVQSISIQDDRTVLHVIAEANNVYACECVIKECESQGNLGTLLNKVSGTFQKTAVHISFDLNNYDIFKILVQREETDLLINHPENDKTLFFIAAEKKYERRFKILFDEHAKRKNLNSAIQTKGNSVPLLFTLYEKKHKFMFDKLLESEVDLGVKHPETKKNLLHLFAEQGDYENFNVFVSKAPDTILKSCINEKEGSGETPLSLAVRKNHYLIVEKLINLGSDYLCNVNGVELIDLPRTFLCCNSQSLQIVWDARHGKYIESVNTDEKKKLLEKALILCLKDGEFEQAKKLIRISPNFEIRDHQGNGPFLLVIQNPNNSETEKLDIIRVLLEKGCDVNQVNASKESVLISAVLKEFSLIVEELTNFLNNDSNKIDLELRDLNGKTALHHAVEKGNESIVKKLLQRNANAMAANNLQQTPLHLTKNKEIAELLILHGAKAEARDNLGRKPEFYISRVPRGDQVGKTVFSSLSELKTSEQAAIHGNKEMAKLYKEHEGNKIIEFEDITPRHEQRSESIKEYALDIADQGMDQLEILSKRTLKELGDAVEEVKTEGINTLKDTAVGLIKTADLPGKAADLVGSITSAAMDKTKQSLLKSISG